MLCVKSHKRGKNGNNRGHGSMMSEKIYNTTNTKKSKLKIFGVLCDSAI